MPTGVRVGRQGAIYAASQSEWFDMTKFNQWFKEASIQLDFFPIRVLALQERLVPVLYSTAPVLHHGNIGTPPVPVL
jgi:hypothetical protein